MWSEFLTKRGDAPMQYFRPGSQLRQLITMLSIVGEYPIRSLYLLGNERAYKALVHKLTTPETFRIPQTEMTTHLFTVIGKGSRSVRFYKGALPILDWLHPDAYRYYMDAFGEHKFPGNAAHRDRNHRVAEAAAMCMRSGVECRPFMLPILQNRTITKRIPDAPCFYLAKELKKLGEAEMNKTMFTRMVGTAYLGQRPYAVYNTRSAVMKWSGKGEFKTLHSVIEISRLNAGTDAAPVAILFGQSESVALKTLLESDTTKRPEFRFDAIYRNLYFIPMDEHGIRQLRLMTVPDWKERLLELLFDPEVRTYDRGLFEYDAKIGDAYVFSHLDGDLARLVRFKEAVQNQRGNYEVLCYSYQMTFIREYLGNRVTIKMIGLDAVEANSTRKGGIYLNDKNRKIAIIIAAILGCVGLFYLGGMLGQLLGNYAAWMDSGGVSGESTMKPVSWNPLICFPAAFSGNGIKGILKILLIAGAIFAYVKLHDKFDGKQHDPRGFARSKSGIYGTASWMDEKEMKGVLEISPVPAAKGTILGEYNGKAVCMPEDTRLNRHIAVFGASGTMKSRAIIRNALFQALRRGESVIVTDSKKLFKRSKPIRPKLKKPKVADTLLSEQKPK